jgi:uncharacterized damage-inducible protein DinB
MKAIDLIRWALQKTDEWVLGAAEDMRDAPLTQPTSRGGNHPLWILGHLAVVEGAIAQWVFGEPNPVEHWRPLFGQGTQPTTDAEAYPPYDEVLEAYRRLRAKNLARLDEIGEADLDAASAAPAPGSKDVMLTRGQLLLLLALHQMTHLGQIADARRAAGREPRF